MKIWNEHRCQGVVAVLQTIVIILGFFILEALSGLVDPDFKANRWSPLLRGVTKYGLMFLLVPVCWAAITLYLERVEVAWYGRWVTIATGVLVWILLAWLFLYCIGEILNPVY